MNWNNLSDDSLSQYVTFDVKCICEFSFKNSKQKWNYRSKNIFQIYQGQITHELEQSK